MAAAFTEGQYEIVSRLIDEKVAQAIGISEGRTTLSLLETRGEAAENIKGSTASSLAQIESAITRVQEATLTRVDEALKAAGAGLPRRYRHESQQLYKVPWIPRGPQHRRSLAAVAAETVDHLVVRRPMGHLVVRKAPQRPFSRQ